jgi:uncharacterized protein
LSEQPIQREKLGSYFILTFAISWIAALCVAAPYLLRHQKPPKLTGLLMFPGMLLGPSLAGILLTRVVDGKAGVSDLARRMRPWSFSPKWYAALLVPPALVSGVLVSLSAVVSHAYRPNLFWPGIAFGLLAGMLEEIGWTGYAYRKMRSRVDSWSAAVLLGAIWAFWHLPVADYLGAATPHGRYWLPFFLAFTIVLVGIRMLIVFMYEHTGSLLLAQLMHASSTSALAVLGSPAVTAPQEALWYAVYGLTLWIAIAALLWLHPVPARAYSKDVSSGALRAKR